MISAHAPDLDAWAPLAASLLGHRVPPTGVLWRDDEPELFAEAPPTGGLGRVPAPLLKMAQSVEPHRGVEKWALLYRVLWRMTHGEPNLLRVSVDDDVRRLALMEKDVRRDIHKMKAFVRFRRVAAEQGDTFIAWHRPDHNIVRAATPFFTRRFGAQNWAILTPDESVFYMNGELQFGPGVSREQAPAGDVTEDLWRTYYRSIFNPARVKVRAMKKEMPVRHWATLPETAEIESLLREAPARVEAMIRHQPASGASYVPAQPASLETLKAALPGCRGCDLCDIGSRAVAGEGPARAELMLVGEAPGDQEDLAGRPFVGPAGAVLQRAMAAAGLERSQVYLTNAVKHFKFDATPARRIHQKPNGAEINACRAWLNAEIDLIQPKIIVCLGATAAQSLLGRTVAVQQERGRPLPHARARHLLVTVHPAFILRLNDAALAAREHARFAADLALARHLLETTAA